MDRIARIGDVIGRSNCMTQQEGVRMIKNVVRTSEMKPVVRCRDCKYGNLCFDANGQGLIQCTNPYYPAAFAETWPFDLDWYCAGGERRDGK